MKNKIKKAFTLVELVVVIAIIAILAAVSVGGYFMYIDQAKATELVTYRTQIKNYFKTETEPFKTSFETGKKQDGTPMIKNVEAVYTTGGLVMTSNTSFDPASAGKVVVFYLDQFFSDGQKKYDMEPGNAKKGTVGHAFSRYREFAFKTEKDNVFTDLSYGKKVFKNRGIYVGCSNGWVSKDNFKITIKDFFYISSYNEATKVFLS